MSSSNKTPHYNLSQFADTDKPTWRGDYNGDMSRIDSAVHDVSGQTVTAMTAATNAQTAANAVKTTADANKARLSEMGVTDTATAAKFKPLPAEVAKVAGDISTLSDRVDADFVTKTTYTAGIGAKADKSSVYTKTESDAKYLTKQTADADYQPKEKKRNIVVIGDSYMTGYQPGGSALAENQRIPQVMAAFLDADVHVFAANAAGYVKSGDGGKTFATLITEAKTALGDAAGDVTDVLVCGGRNDASGNIRNQIWGMLATVVDTFTSADIWVAFLWDNNSVSNEAANVINEIRVATAPSNPWSSGRNVRMLENAPFYGMTFADCFANNGSDIHPNAKGARRYASLLAGALSGAGDVVSNHGTATASKSGVSGDFKWRIYGGVLSLTAKFSCSSAVKSGAQIVQLPKCFNLGDGFIPALINAGDKIAYLHLQDGKLVYTGATAGGGDMSGNCWIMPTAWTPVANL